MKDPEDIIKAINYLESKYNSGNLSDSDIAKVQSSLDKYSNSNNINDNMTLSRLYELQSYLHALNGDNDSSFNFISEAARLNNLNFCSKSGADIYDFYISETSNDIDQNGFVALHKQPTIKKKTSTKVWQFFATVILGLIILAGLQVISWILNIVGTVLFFYELYYVTTGKVTIVDVIFRQKYGKVIFWIVAIILIMLAIYVPQKWGEWTASTTRNDLTLNGMQG